MSAISPANNNRQLIPSTLCARKSFRHHSYEEFFLPSRLPEPPTPSMKVQPQIVAEPTTHVLSALPGRH